MNICIITSSFPSHPNDTVQAPFLIDFIEGLNRREHRVFLFTQDRKGTKEAFLRDVQVKWFPWMGAEKPLVQMNPIHPLDCLRIGSLFYKGKKALPPFLKENKVDMCLALWVLPAGYFANHAHRQTEIPYSVWALGSDIYRYGNNPFLYPIMRRIIQEAAGVFADGFDLSKRVEERFGRRCSFMATARTIHSETLQLNEPHGPERPYEFLFVGRLERVKGIDLLLDALALLKEEGTNLHLTVVGVGSRERWARNFVGGKGLEKWVTFEGNVDDKTLASLYALSDCVVIPSRSESIPLVFSEALNFDKQLIVTDVGDMGTLGRRYGVACVIPPEDPVALKEMMKKKAQFPSKEKMVGDDSKRNELRKLLDIDASVDRFLADYL